MIACISVPWEMLAMTVATAFVHVFLQLDKLSLSKCTFVCPKLMLRTLGATQLGRKSYLAQTEND